LSGRKEALKKLNLIKEQKEYNTMRNFLSYKTSNISAYINLGLISIRELYFKIIEKLGINNNLIDELYWRDFYLRIMFEFPPKHTPLKKLSNQNEKKWQDWKNGNTNIPIVDACMHQLNETGYMHNRGRMIVASYLIKNMKIPYEYGEYYFSEILIDYNDSSNNGGWQWVNGSGFDSQPHYQKFNMYIQNKKYDPECKYIKKWIPKLKDMDIKDIFKLYNIK
jgi:deoxyribodipyrimidine photo-lyase